MSHVLRLSCFISILFASPLFAETTLIGDPLNLAGTYQCTGHDSHDGDFTGEVTLVLSKAGSDLKQKQMAYLFTLKAKIGDATSQYTGYAAAKGDTLAVYFANDDKQDKIGRTDYGVGTASVSHHKTADGKITTTLNKFYYLPEYKTTGGYGRETCVKSSRGEGEL